LNIVWEHFFAYRNSNDLGLSTDSSPVDAP